MEENKDFFKWYKKRITDNQEEPPADAWQNISDGLDINDVWQKVSAQLDHDGGWFSQRPLYYAMPVVLLFLLSGGLFYDYKADTMHVARRPLAVTTDSVQFPTTELQPDPAKNPSTAAFPSKPSPASPDALTHKVSPYPGTITPPSGNPVTNGVATRESREEHADIEKTQPPASLPPADRQSEKTVESQPDAIRPADVTGRPGAKTTQENAAIKNPAFPLGDEPTSEQPGFETKVHYEPGPEAPDAETSASIAGENNGKTGAINSLAMRAAVTSLELPDSMLMVNDVDVLLHPVSIELMGVERAPAPLMYDKTLEFGITASLKNTWLINRKTLLGLEKHTLNTTIPDFGKDIGVVAAYNFSRRWSLQAEGMFISESGQRYKEYRNGKYVTREVDLNYYGFNLLVRYNRRKMAYGDPKNGHGITAGIFAGALKKATDRIHDKTLDGRALYHDHNYGMLLGYEYNRYIFSNLVITSGLRVSYGFPNIDTGLFYRTFTGSFDFNMALKYRIGL